MSGESLVGALGRVTVSIPLGGPGEVLLAVRGGAEAYAAWCDEVVPRHAQVLVIGQLSGRSVQVTPFSGPSQPRPGPGHGPEEA
ncbi:MAG: hypothetical protein ACRDY0_02580 [Acidimicrobiales bacterium]